MKRHLLLGCTVSALLTLSACVQDSGTTTDGNKSMASGLNANDAPIAYAMRSNKVVANPTNGAPTAPGGDIIIRERASGSAADHNITNVFTQGVGDASGPEPSYDGKKLLFAMRCPVSNTATITEGGAEVKACTGHWNIWEYDMTSGGLTGGTYRRLTSLTDSTAHDDVDPTYLPGGRGVVFTSNRQTKSSGKDGYFALDEYEREQVFNLHTMDAKGGNITQISFNQSHDRSPVIRQNGEIMFSRWDHVGGRNHFKIFRVKPDGTDMFVLYGAHSTGNSFLHPREMDPNGPYKGFIASDLMPLSGTREGGALVFVDAANFSEENAPVGTRLPGESQSGQAQPAAFDPLNFNRGLSTKGRITTPYPLWDGTNRLLLSFTPCAVHRKTDLITCDQLTDDEKKLLARTDRLQADIANDTIKDDVAPNYGIFIVDPSNGRWDPIALAPEGFMYTHPVALLPRPEPSTVDPVPPEVALAKVDEGLIEVRSVYDTDDLGRMGNPMMLDVDKANGCGTPIPQVVPPAALKDTRATIADIKRMKDPADTAYGCAPARFIRVFRAVAPPVGGMGTRAAIGATDFEMQKVIGYAPIEPDGSFKLRIPADTPIGLAVIDSEGRAFQTHTNWIQVRPGERRTCDGCHSPRRGGAINSGDVVNAIPAAILSDMQKHGDGETMASTRTRLDAERATTEPKDPLDAFAKKPEQDMIFTDVWADPAKAKPRPDIKLTYAGLKTAPPTEGIINYPEHIQPLWTLARGDTKGSDTCTNCHNAKAKLDGKTKLDLSATVSGTGRLTSYEALMVGDAVIDSKTNLPKIVIRNGIPMVERDPALVDTGASEGEAMGLTRKSRLAEILWGQTMAAGADALLAHPKPALDHSKMLNASEKRLIAEWMDLGGKYYNAPYVPGATPRMARVITGLSQVEFDAKVFPILQTTCANGCHQAIGSNEIVAGSSFRDNRFVLTGDKPGDYNVTLTMIADACSPDSNALLKRPSTVPHPSGGSKTAPAILPTASAAYLTIANWVKSGCTSP